MGTVQICQCKINDPLADTSSPSTQDRQIWDTPIILPFIADYQLSTDHSSLKKQQEKIPVSLIFIAVYNNVSKALVEGDLKSVSYRIHLENSCLYPRKVCIKTL